MLDAMNPLKFARAQALQQSPARPAGCAQTQGNASQPSKLQNGPAADVFTRAAKAPADVAAPQAATKPSFGNTRNATQKTGAAAFVQSLKDMLPTRNQPVKVEKTAKSELPALGNATQRQPVALKPEAGQSLKNMDKTLAQATERMATTTQRPTTNPFNHLNEKLQKKNLAGFSAALPLASIGLLAIPVAGPAALVAKPSLMTQVVAALPAVLP